MQTALDAFRAQREAADQVHARLSEVAQLLDQLTKQVDAVAGNADLRRVLRDERDWLREAQLLLEGVRHFREQERLRYWPGVWRRGALAVLFALIVVAATGAGYALVTRGHLLGATNCEAIQSSSGALHLTRRAALRARHKGPDRSLIGSESNQ